MSTTHIDSCIDVCNSLLRGEISAIETYNQAIKKFRGEPAVKVLEQIRADHTASANRLRENVRDMGGEPSNDSGTWGAVAKTVEGAAKLFGEKSALKGLQEGEEHGQKEYEDALENSVVMDSCKKMIRSELLPRQQEHINCLKALKAVR